VVFVFSTTCHEAAHAWISYLGGDKTAYEGGQVSLDPMPHIKREPFGMVILPVLSMVMMGWMLGFASAPYDPRWAQRHPQKYALMSLAGPSANFILAIIAFVLIWGLASAGVLDLASRPVLDEIVVAPLGSGGSVNPALAMLAKALSVLLGLNIVLGLLNLIPLPPLDGASVVEGFWPSATGGFYQRLRTSPGMSILGLLVAMNVFKYIGWPVLGFVIALLHGSV
jgi:Zn-dependent protease